MRKLYSATLRDALTAALLCAAQLVLAIAAPIAVRGEAEARASAGSGLQANLAPRLDLATPIGALTTSLHPRGKTSPEALFALRGPLPAGTGGSVMRTHVSAAWSLHGRQAAANRRHAAALASGRAPNRARYSANANGKLSRAGQAVRRKAACASDGPPPDIGDGDFDCDDDFVNIIGGGSPAGGFARCFTPLPVNCAQGNFYHTFGDFLFRGRGVPTSFTHSYDSALAAFDSPLGFGWAHSYNMNITQDSSGNLYVENENGAADKYTLYNGQYYGNGWIQATLVKNADGTFTNKRFQSQISFIYSSGGYLWKIVNRNGYTTTLGYDQTAPYNMRTITDPGGRTVWLYYNSANRISQAVDFTGRTVYFDYLDGNGNLTDVTDVNGNDTHFTYDAQHHILTMTDPNGGVVTNHYPDPVNSYYVDWQTDQLGRKTSFAFYSYPNSNGQYWQVGITDPSGNTAYDSFDTNIFYDESLGATQPYSDWNIGTWTGTNDTTSVGTYQPWQIKDPNGNTHTMTYDNFGNTLTNTDNHGYKTTFTYDALNDVTSVKDPAGNVVSFTYDGNGNVLTAQRTLTSTGQTQTTAYTYGDANHPGDVTMMTDPNGKNTAYTYDPNTGDTLTRTDPLGNTTAYSFDSLGRIASITTARNYKTTYAYQAWGHNPVVQITDPINHSSYQYFDGNGNLVQTTDGNGNAVIYTFDAANQQTQIRRADGTTIKNVYNGDGTLQSQIDGLGRSTGYVYDSLARMTSTTDPLGRITRFGYDLAGNRTSLTDADGAVETFTFDQNYNNTGTSYSRYQLQAGYFSFDAVNRRTFMQEGFGDGAPYTIYNYDSLNRLFQITDFNNQLVAYGYDLKGQVTSINYAGGGTVTKVYDSAGRLTSVRDWLNHTTTFGYDTDGNLTSVRADNGSGNGFAQTATVNGNGNVMSLAAANRNGVNYWSATYTRDNVEQLVSLNEQPGTAPAGSVGLPPGRSQTFAYSATNELTKINGSIVYTYDAADNMTTVGSHDAANELLAPYRFDVKGDRTSSNNGVTPFTYGQENELLTYGHAASYSYNPDSLRISKYVSGNPAAILRKASVASSTPGRNAPSDNRHPNAARSKQTGALNTLFLWDENRAVPLLLGESRSDGTRSFYVYGPNSIPVERIDVNGGVSSVYFYFLDQVGSVRLVVNAAGIVVGSATFDPYGKVTQSAGSIGALGFAGQYTDAETGFQYLRARYYDPATAQFITRDPFGAETRQPYSYAANNPLNLSDPTGEFPECLKNLLVNFGIGFAYGSISNSVGQLIDNGRNFGNFNLLEAIDSGIGTGVQTSLTGVPGTSGARAGGLWTAAVGNGVAPDTFSIAVSGAAGSGVANALGQFQSGQDFDTGKYAVSLAYGGLSAGTNKYLFGAPGKLPGAGQFYNNPNFRSPLFSSEYRLKTWFASSKAFHPIFNSWMFGGK